MREDLEEELVNRVKYCREVRNDEHQENAVRYCCKGNISDLGESSLNLGWV